MDPARLEDSAVDMLRKIFSSRKNSRLWRSIARHPFPDNLKTRLMVVRNNIFLHLHPARLPALGVRVNFTWCMGGITFFLFLVETASGILLMFYYRPTPEFAYMDIVDMKEQLSFGILREMHRWAAHAMVITIWLHMLRVFMTGSYKRPREFNWVIGVVLLVLTMLLSFTGYLLPWDQLSLWAVTVGTNMARAAPFIGYEGPGVNLLSLGETSFIHQGSDLRYLLLGGKTVGPEALLRFYVLHCVLIPLLAAILMAVHFWRIRKDGGISTPL